MKNKSTPRFVLSCLSIVLAFAVHSSSAQTAITTWVAPGGGDWFSSTNWDPGLPATSTDAFINNGRTAKVEGFQATAGSPTLGTNVPESGNVTVDGTNGGFLSVGPCSACNAASAAGSIYVGNGGGGTLTITNGGTVVSDGYAYIALLGDGVAGGVNSNGAVTVDGAGSTWTLGGTLPRLFIGGSNSGNLEGGTALLSVTNGGVVTVNSPPMAGAFAISVGISGTVTGNGTITANGASLNSRRVIVNGTLAPTGTLHLNGNLVLVSRATMLCSVTPGAADRVDVSETATLGGRLSVMMGGTFTPGVTRYALLYAGGGRDPNAPQFSSTSIKYPTDQGFTPHITYDGNYVYLDLVFEQGGL